MPVGRSGGCLSTVLCQPRCVMVKTRPAQRNTDAGSVPRSDAQGTVRGVNKMVHTSTTGFYRATFGVRLLIMMHNEA